MTSRSMLAPLAAALVLAGCYESTTLGGPRPGPVDAGPIVFPDTSPPPPPPPPPPPMDAGRPDAGDPCAGGETIPSGVGPLCAEETLFCLEDCAADPDPSFCQEECFAADPACSRCFNREVIACANEVGCQAAWDDFACCASEVCPELGGADRLGCFTGCEMLLDVYIDCVNVEAVAICEDAPFRCFP